MSKKDKDKVVGIVGLGYVGLPLLISFSKHFDVIGFDSDQSKVESINSRISQIEHIPSEDLNAIESKFELATTDFSMIDEVDAIIICVPTPITIHKDPDLSYVKNVMNEILPYLKEGQLNYQLLSRGSVWLDTGTVDSLHEASSYIRTIEKRQGLKVGCPEEIAWRLGWIDDNKLENLAFNITSSGYGNYLLSLLS